MSKFTIYGSQQSRAGRVAWCARELGVPFEHTEIPFEDLKKADYLAINPNGKVPGFVEGDLKLFESLAINLYLAKKYGTGELYPANAEDEARVMQWTLWAATELEPYLLPALLFALGFSKDEAAAKAAQEKATPGFKVLDATLANRQWLVGNRFSVADLNVACVVNLAIGGKVDFSFASNVQAWLERCNARPARH
jgi:glutathione S-transferase